MSSVSVIHCMASVYAATPPPPPPPPSELVGERVILCKSLGPVDMTA